MDFNDLKVILGVFHDIESIYDTFKAIRGSFKSLPVENTNFLVSRNAKLEIIIDLRRHLSCIVPRFGGFDAPENVWCTHFGD